MTIVKSDLTCGTSPCLTGQISRLGILTCVRNPAAAQVVAQRFLELYFRGEAAEGTPAEASGAWWMNHRIDVALSGDFQGMAFRLDRK